MKIVWITLAILFFLIIIIFITKVNVFISYVHYGDNDELTLRLVAWKWIKYTIKIPLIKIDDSSPSIIIKEKQRTNIKQEEERLKLTLNDFLKRLRQIVEMIDHISGFYRILKRLLKRIRVHQFEWKSKIGIGDASMTGLLCGMLWSLKGMIIGVVYHYMNLQNKPLIQIAPNFQDKILQTRFQCMISFRLGHAIFAGLLFVRYWKKRPKEENSNE